MKLSMITTIIAVAAVSVLASCAEPAKEREEKKREQQRHTYKELKPEVVPVPQAVREALPGLLNDNIYLYKEIAPTANLVAYTPEYSRASAIRMMAEAFEHMAEAPELRQGIEFWIIQVQPKKPEPAVAEEPGQARSKVVVWGVRPKEVDRYLQSGDLAEFIMESEYMMVDDRIIAKGLERLEQFPSLGLQPPLQQEPEEEAPKPEEGSGTENPPDGKPVNR